MNRKLQDVKDVARNPYAWPGGYPRFVVMADGEALCPACARSEFRLIARATLDSDQSGWSAEGSDINWEDSELYCAHCDGQIPPAYGKD